MNSPENNQLAWNHVSLIDEPALSFAGTPGDCRSRSEATLRLLYGGLANAAGALGFTSPAARMTSRNCGEYLPPLTHDASPTGGALFFKGERPCQEDQQ